ncbi:ribonuclease P protein component [Nocardioides iriomotensis]|uniref:Ribonuclease P protein component n=1 Tax=Nocardioides iriomotensis TaxID=715784 RepID=A0A4Q5IWC9_9ACTN|nr:ribonuclease P protein component [Nocardioides iriomotensis]RYU10243.1 ribonuclease P protein component [Nocardioides iriomotensis]
MLTRAQRLTSSRGFSRTVRHGRRAGSRTMVLHLVAVADQDDQAVPAQVGFVVSKAVGGAVVRNQVKRRLRHLARERHASLPGSAVLVVRALPAAATASYAELGADLDRALDRLLGRSSTVSSPAPLTAADPGDPAVPAVLGDPVDPAGGRSA